jgi:hypothetical protein
LEFAGSCKYEQLIKLLAELNGNPYLVSIEELTIKGNEQKPEQVDVKMVLGTFIK